MSRHQASVDRRKSLAQGRSHELNDSLEVAGRQRPRGWYSAGAPRRKAGQNDGH